MQQLQSALYSLCPTQNTHTVEKITGDFSPQKIYLYRKKTRVDF